MNSSLFLTNIFLLAGMTFLLISVLGELKFGFAEINPGLFGRIVALVIGVLYLIITVLLVIFPSDILQELIRNSLLEQLQQNINLLNKTNG